MMNKKYQVVKAGKPVTAALTLDEAIKAIRKLEETYLMFHPGAPIPFVLMPAE
tara:strand:+ start:589 stop:747 length:159 start_codon:yes stop_codon:yes gene_type:complete